MAGLKLNFPKLHNSSETAYPPKHSLLDKGQIGLNFKLSYIELTKRNGKRKPLSRSWVCRLLETFRDNTEFCVKVAAQNPLSS